MPKPPPSFGVVLPGGPFICAVCLHNRIAAPCVPIHQARAPQPQESAVHEAHPRIRIRIRRTELVVALLPRVAR